MSLGQLGKIGAEWPRCCLPVKLELQEENKSGDMWLQMGKIKAHIFACSLPRTLSGMCFKCSPFVQAKLCWASLHSTTWHIGNWADGNLCEVCRIPSPRGEPNAGTAASLWLCAAEAFSVFQRMDVLSWAVLNLPKLKEMFLLNIWRAHKGAPNGDESMQLQKSNDSQSQILPCLHSIVARVEPSHWVECW